MSYLGNLALRLAGGALRLAEPLRRRHGDYLAGLQAGDGGFPGRQGAGDLYYTGFGLRGLALLGRLDEPIARRAAGFLHQRLGSCLATPLSGHRAAVGGRGVGGEGAEVCSQPLSAPMASIDLLSLVYSAVLLEVACGIDLFADAGMDRVRWVAASVEPLRRPDGGYAKSERSGPSSTYYTFLTAACTELIGVPLDQPERICEMVRRRQRDDGGFVELDAMRHSGTNPTAAAVGLLRLLDGLDEATASGAAGFLAQMQNVEGGLRANTRIPAADLLSTFTGLVALADLGVPASVDRQQALQYVTALERPEGGFRGALWDEATDAEYTFYGLGARALLAGPDAG